MNAKLLVVLGKTTKREVALKLPAVLGRSRDADVTVAHPLISRRHCEISEQNGLLMLHDMTSLNGTMIGGRRVATAPLLPDAEFTIGPLTFRVLYEYNGDLESVPDTLYIEAPEGATEAAPGDAAAADYEVEEPLPSEPASMGDSAEMALPDFMALADAEVEEIVPLALPPTLAALARPTAPAAPRRTPIPGRNPPPVPVFDAHDEPPEVDSSLQSGGHVQESPWAVEPQPVEVPPHKPHPPAHAAPKKPAYSDDNDPEFGSFLEGLE